MILEILFYAIALSLAWVVCVTANKKRSKSTYFPRHGFLKSVFFGFIGLLAEIIGSEDDAIDEAYDGKHFADAPPSPFLDGYRPHIPPNANLYWQMFDQD